MRTALAARHQLRIALAPARSGYNSFIDRFAASLADGGFRITEFSWNPLRLAGVAVVILHWPNEFFTAGSRLTLAKAHLKLRLLRILKRTCGLRVVWVAHNARPHEAQRSVPALTQRFLETLDGIIHLSRHSRATIGALYRLHPALHELVSAHGHYRDARAPRPQPAPRPTRQVRLVCFGQVRPYKNVEELIRCAARLRFEDLHLTVIGVAGDARLAARLTQMAAAAPNVWLALRTSPLSEAELGATVDAAHAVVLPYREILNSGAALFGLSRSRPVLAPRLGSLPELQRNVGSDWVHLYEGPLCSAVLEEFVGWMRARGSHTQPDLSAYDWDRIGPATCRFIDQLRTSRAACPGPHCHPSG